jgi:hypothetical protein
MPSRYGLKYQTVVLVQRGLIDFLSPHLVPIKKPEAADVFAYLRDQVIYFDGNTYNWVKQSSA